MSLYAKHTISDIEDTVQGVVSTLQTQLAGVVASDDVVLAFKDERSDAAGDRTFPRVTVHLYNCRPAGRRRQGSVNKSFTHTIPNSALAAVTFAPTPVDLMFQIDAYAVSHEQEWAIQQKLLPMTDLVHQTKVTTLNGREFYLLLDAGQPLDEIETDNLFRTAWRCRAEIWFASAGTPTGDAYVVLQRNLTMQNELWKMDSVP